VVCGSRIVCLCCSCNTPKPIAKELAYIGLQPMSSFECRNKHWATDLHTVFTLQLMWENVLPFFFTIFDFPVLLGSHRYNSAGEQGCCGGESASLLPTKIPGFDSRIRCHMLTCCQVFLRNSSIFLPSIKQQFQIPRCLALTGHASFLSMMCILIYCTVLYYIFSKRLFQLHFLQNIYLN